MTLERGADEAGEARPEYLVEQEARRAVGQADVVDDGVRAAVVRSQLVPYLIVNGLTARL
jgi:hypothetical protein